MNDEMDWLPPAQPVRAAQPALSPIPAQPTQAAAARPAAAPSAAPASVPLKGSLAPAGARPSAAPAPAAPASPAPVSDPKQGRITVDDLRAWMQEAFDKQNAGEFDASIQLYRRVLAVRPDLRGAWANLGVVYRRHKRPDLSVPCYIRALDGDDRNAGVWGNLGNAYKDLERFDEALAAHKKAVECDPKAIGLLHNYGVCLSEAGDPEGALAVFNRVVEHEPDHIDAHWDRGIAKLKMGRFTQDAWDDYDWRWKLGELSNYKPPTTKPFWKGEPLNGRTLMVYSEQGFGDTLFALRYMTKLKGIDGKLILRCQPDLARLVGQMAKDVGFTVSSAKEAPPPHDLALPIMSIIGLFTRSIDDIPPPAQLSIPPGAGAKAMPRIAQGGDKFKVGIIWSGSVTFRGNARRAVSLDRFLRFAEIPGVQLYSLQKGPPFAEYQKMQPHPLVIDLGSTFEDFADTAAAIRKLDLVLMTDSSVAHLAASLGAPVWDLVNYNTYWIYFRDRIDCPWYPSMRLWRQKRHSDWDGLFEEVAQALEAHVRDVKGKRK